MITIDKTWIENTNVVSRKRHAIFTFNTGSLIYFRNRCEAHGYFVMEDFDNNVSNEVILEKVNSLCSNGVNTYLFGFIGSDLSFTYEECDTVLNYLKKLYKKLNKMDFFDIKYITDSAKYLLKYRSKDFADKIVEEYFVKGSKDITDSLIEAITYHGATPEMYSALLGRISYIRESVEAINPIDIESISNDRVQLTIKFELIKSMLELLVNFPYLSCKVTLPSGKIIVSKTNNTFYLIAPYLQELKEIREILSKKIEKMREVRNVLTQVDHSYDETYKYARVLTPLSNTLFPLKRLVLMNENYGIEYIKHAYTGWDTSIISDNAFLRDSRNDNTFTDEWFKDYAVSVKRTGLIPMRVSHSCRVKLTSELC